MRVRSLVVLVLTATLTITPLAPRAAFGDGGSGGPYYLATAGQFALVRGGERLTGEDLANAQARIGDRFFFTEKLYHSTASGAQGTRAGRSMVTCLVSFRGSTFCDATLILRDRGAIYMTTSTAGSDRFLWAIVGGTRDFKATRGDVVLTGTKTNHILYQLRLR